MYNTKKTSQMKKLFKFTIFMAMLAIATTGCKKDSDDKNNQNPDNPAMQTVTLKGRVKDTSGNPIGGVRVTTGTLNTTTGNDGTFNFTQAEVVNSRAVIKFEKSGYFMLTRSREKENEMFIEAVLYPKGNSKISLQTSFDASSAKELEVSGMKVALSASSVVRADGSAYSGTVNADMLYLDPNNGNFATMMPGGDLAAIRSDNSNVMLISWGMTNVNLTDKDGNPLQLKSGSPAALTFPIPEGMENNPPTTIPLWHFDEDKGIWVESGVATLDGDVYKGTATHFSWVNLDEPAKRVTIKGKVVDCANKPVSYVQVKAGQTAGITNSKGEYSVIVPEWTPVTLLVTANGGSDSQDVPGQPGNTTYTAQNLTVPCGDDKPGEIGTQTKMEKGSIKYLMGGELIYIITFDNNGKRFRWDMLFDDENPDEHMAYIINHINKTYWMGYGDNGYEEWMDYPYNNAENSGIPFSINDEAFSSYYQTNMTIAGKSCRVYNISTGGYEMKYASWNGMMMLMEMDGEVLWMALAATTEAPEVAFTKTMNITWLP
jgi:hypothetical protein